MIGTRSSRLLNYDPEHWARQVAHRNPDLQIIMFGGNEVGDSGSLATYEEKYREALQRLRAGAQAASCLMMTPVDHGERKRGRIRTVPRLLRMIPIQERLAKEMGCGFLNTFEAMGGEGAIGRWYYDVRPRLAWADFAHLTPAGDQVLGAMIYKAIMKGFSDWLQRGTTPQAATTPSAPEVSSPTPETSSPETPAPEAPEPETTRPLPAPEAPEPETTRPLPAPEAPEPETTRPLPAPTAGENP
jgi:lysophospholipase L1-like esterase